jgi:hypothetical protein
MVMTTHDQNKKTLRHFQCRDYLWEVFEQMSTELECSTDYLINEAMRQYARSRNYGTARSNGPREDALSTGDLQTDQPEPRNLADLDQQDYRDSSGIPSLRDSERNMAPTPPPSRARVGTPANLMAPGAEPEVVQSGIASMAPAAMSPAPAPRRPTGSGSLPPLPPPPPRSRGPVVASAPPPLPGQPRSAQPGAAQRPRQLFIIFNGQKIPVTKEEFVIGRGSKSADLAIKDGNISRRHAAVVLHNGAYYLRDLGSTNGVEFHGRRFDSKRIDEGDLFRICDYELRFTYQ